jgi:hypothetical protein
MHMYMVEPRYYDVYVYVYVHPFTCVHTWANARGYTRVNTCVHPCTPVYTCANLCTPAYTRAHVSMPLYTQRHKEEDLHNSMRVSRVSLYPIYMHTCIHTHMSPWGPQNQAITPMNAPPHTDAAVPDVCVCVCVCIDKHTHTHTQIYIEIERDRER